MVLLVAGLAAAAGCRTAVEQPALDPAALAEAREALSRPLSGDMAALYQLRVPSSGALRLALLAAGEAGRMTISEPFGGALSVTAWAAGRPTRVFDLRDGCWRSAESAGAGLGVSAMPLPQAVRLLGGRLPAAAGDRVVERADGRLEVVGDGWRALVTVAPEPWRVIAVDELAAGGGDGWRVLLRDHTGSVPGGARIDGADRGWAELELVRLEWDGGGGLPDEPGLPPCGAPAGGRP